MRLRKLALVTIAMASMSNAQASIKYIERNISGVSISRSSNTLMIELSSNFDSHCTSKNSLRLEADDSLVNNFQSIALAALASNRTVKISYDNAESCLVSTAKINFIQMK